VDTRCSAAGDSALSPFLALIGLKLDAIPYRRIADGKGQGKTSGPRSAPASSCLIGPRRDVCPVRRATTLHLQLWHSGSASYLAKSISRFETRVGGRTNFFRGLNC
jgi:hypothetical protein